jgi:hypothetical protein
MPLEIGAQGVLLEQTLQALFDGGLQNLHGGAFGRAALELPAQPVEIDLADIVWWRLFSNSRLGLCLNRLIDDLMQLADDIGDIRLLTVCCRLL